MGKLKDLEQELAGFEDDLKTCADYLAIEPDDAESQETKAFLEEQIASVRAQIAEEKSKQNATAPPPPPGDDAPPPPPKYDMSKHPKFQKQDDAPPPPPDEVQHSFEVKDVVSAKWSEDKQWYPATVISKTGSSHDPVYTVTFKGYGNTETKRKHEIRPSHTESKKRKADGSPAVPAAPQMPASPKPVTSTGGPGHVISAAPAVDTSLVQPKHIPSKVSDGPTRMAPEPKKLKGQKQLQKNQSNWQSWAQAGPKKTGFAGAGASKKKDSMFRTPDLPNAKVGFTGSGKPMQKDQARAKWEYGKKPAEEE